MKIYLIAAKREAVKTNVVNVGGVVVRSVFCISLEVVSVVLFYDRFKIHFR